MKERPILFSGDMVRAILDGRKTQTRRVVKPQPPRTHRLWGRVIDGQADFTDHPSQGEKGDIAHARCPYGVPGDQLWVRETWRTEQQCDHLSPSEIAWEVMKNYSAAWAPIEYMDGTRTNWDGVSRPGRTRPSIHMPRWASRITLEVVDVRVERVQEITDDEALAEGVDRANSSIPTYATQRFQKLWDSINATRGYGWESNPFVWVVEFRQVQP